MTRNIDSLADGSRDRKSPREELEETFLRSRPRSQWPPYLDETAKDLTSGIAIGHTDLDVYNFPREVGPLYREGLLASTESHSDLPKTLDELDETDLGRAMLLLNRLSYEINQSDTGLENIQRAVSAVLEKILSDTTENKITPRLGTESNSTADVLLQMLSDPVVADEVETVLEQFEETYNSGLLAKLDEPQMMTPLWNHQRDALDQWLAAECRGYADMATATGKTVLGLAAIAAQYGSLHPLDSDIDPTMTGGDGKADVLVVAHNDLILEQWRREFDRHLNIPPDRTRGSDDVDLTWGRIHFRTAQTLLNQDLIEYDLVVLDEAHHYASGTGWGQLLDSFDNHVLALSGSVDSGRDDASTVRDRLESRIGPECMRYTLAQAQKDGVIPTFDWAIEYAGTAESGGEFTEITEKAEVEFRKFREKLERGELDVSTDRRLRTFEDVRRYSHTTEGESLKRNDDQFRDLVTTLFSRRTQRWNQSPDLDAVIDVVTRHLDRKVVVLTNNNAQVELVADDLRDHPDVDEKTVYTVTTDQTSREQRSTVDRFDIPGEPGVLVGTGDLLGEGVDMHHAEVGVNMATGGVNKQLVQRIGRVLRNPGAGKRAHFVNVVGVPLERGTQVPDEDGQRLVEDALQFRAFGDSFENAPSFTVSDQADTAGLERLLGGGYDRISSLDDDDLYEWPEQTTRRETLEQLVTAITDHEEVGATLDAWSGGADSRDPGRGSRVPGELVLTVVDDDGVPVEGAFVSLAGEAVASHGRTDAAGEVRFSGVRSECTAGVHTPAGGIRSVDVDPESKESTTMTITVSPRAQSLSGVES